MLDRVKTYVNEGSLYYGLEVCEYPEGEKFHLLEIQRKKQELFIQREETFDTLESVASTLKKDVPLFLIINTGKVLTKVTTPNANANYEALVHRAFPNLDFNSFYYELVKTEENMLIAISRKEEVMVYLDKLSELYLNPMGVSLGVSPITNITNYIGSGNFSTTNFQIFLTGTLIEKIVPLSVDDFNAPQQYTINGLEVGRKYVLGFSSILGHLSKNCEGFGNIQETKVFHKNEFVNKRHFKLLLKSSLLFILGLLFLNFLVFNHYFEKVGSLEEALAVKNANKEQLLRLNAEVKRKEERLNVVLAMTNSNTSAILDDLAKDLPASVLLNEIQYQPLRRPLRDSKPVELESNTILVSGAAGNSTDFYNWIASLEKLTWIQSVETTDYDYGTRNTSNFSIKIAINE